MKIYKLIFDKTFGKIIRLCQSSLLPQHLIRNTVSLIKEYAIQDSARYGYENFSDAMQFNKKSDLWNFCLERSQNINLQFFGNLDLESSKPLLIVEFGVWKGKSINYFAKKCPSARVYGFDSFEGLEEDWTGTNLPKKFFSTNGKVPKCESNVKLFKGWFEETIFEFIKIINDEQISVLHMDADTYKPTKFVLNTLRININVGTIIIFDEYYGYPNWRAHEFRAFKEFITEHGLSYKYIGFTHAQVAVEVI